MEFVQGKGVHTGLHQLGHNTVGVSRGIAVLETAGIGGDGHIEGNGFLLGDRSPLADDVVNQFAAGRPPGVQTGLGGEKLLRGMVVDGQIDAPLQPGLTGVGEETDGGNVHADHLLGRIALRGQQALQIGGKKVGGPGLGTDIGGLAQAAKGAAQGGGAANSIAVGTAVGQDEELIPALEPGGGLFKGNGFHSSSSSTMWALAGLAGLTTVSSRSRERMWAPWSMESSSTNWSSGV